MSEDEHSTGIYASADYDENHIITVKEEGWFDGDDVTAEIKEVGDVY